MFEDLYDNQSVFSNNEQSSNDSIWDTKSSNDSIWSTNKEHEQSASESIWDNQRKESNSIFETDSSSEQSLFGNGSYNSQGLESGTNSVFDSRNINGDSNNLAGDNSTFSELNIRESSYGDFGVIDKMRGINSGRLNNSGEVDISEQYGDKYLDKRTFNGAYNVTLSDIYTEETLFKGHFGLYTDSHVEENENYLLEGDMARESKNDNKSEDIQSIYLEPEREIQNKLYNDFSNNNMENDQLNKLPQNIFNNEKSTNNIVFNTSSQNDSFPDKKNNFENDSSVTLEIKESEKRLNLYKHASYEESEKKEESLSDIYKIDNSFSNGNNIKNFNETELLKENTVKDTDKNNIEFTVNNNTDSIVEAGAAGAAGAENKTPQKKELEKVKSTVLNKIKKKEDPFNEYSEENKSLSIEEKDVSLKGVSNKDKSTSTIKNKRRKGKIEKNDFFIALNEANKIATESAKTKTKEFNDESVSSLINKSKEVAFNTNKTKEENIRKLKSLKLKYGEDIFSDSDKEEILSSGNIKNTILGLSYFELNEQLKKLEYEYNSLDNLSPEKNIYHKKIYVLKKLMMKKVLG